MAQPVISLIGGAMGVITALVQWRVFVRNSPRKKTFGEYLDEVRSQWWIGAGVMVVVFAVVGAAHDWLEAVSAIPPAFVFAWMGTFFVCGWLWDGGTVPG